MVEKTLAGALNTQAEKTLAGHAGREGTCWHFWHAGTLNAPALSDGHSTTAFGQVQSKTCPGCSAAERGNQAGTFRDTRWYFQRHTLARSETHAGTFRDTCWHVLRHTLALSETHAGTFRDTCWHF